MDNQVKYTVTANDMLSGKLQGMNSSAQTLEGTMGGLSKIMGTLGIGFAVFKGLEFVKDGIESVEKLHQAQAQVNAGLESTGGIAGLTAKGLQEMAAQFASTTKSSRSDITELQSVMLTFPAIVKETFPQATQAILDMSTRLGTDAKSSAIQVGKALQDPIRGITALRRVGVNFSESQTDVIKKLVETGQKAKAQGLILAELNTEFGGSAAAAFNADPLAKFSKMMGSLKMAIGEGAMAILESLMPAMEMIAGAFKSFGNGIKEVIHWLEEHNNVAQSLKIFLGSVVAIIIIYNTQQKLAALYTAFTTASFIATTFAAGAMTAGMAGASMGGMVLAGVMALLQSVNPFFYIVVAIAAVVTAVMYCYNHFEKFRATVWAVGAVIKEYIMVWGDLFKGFGIILQGVFTMDLGKIKEGFNKITDTVKNSATRIGKAAKDGYKSGLGDFAKDKAEEGKEKKTTKGLAGVKPMATTAAVKPKEKTSAVSGSKVVTINVTIGSLINDFQIKTTNLQESTTAIKDKVTQALTSALNDSQIIAGQ